MDNHYCCQNTCQNVCDICSQNYDNTCTTYVPGPTGPFTTQEFLKVASLGTVQPFDPAAPITFQVLFYENGTDITFLGNENIGLEGDHIYCVTYKVVAELDGLSDSQITAWLTLNNQILDYSLMSRHVINGAQTVEVENVVLVRAQTASILNLYLEDNGPGVITLTEAVVSIFELL